MSIPDSLPAPCVTYYWRHGRVHWEIRLGGVDTEADLAGAADTEKGAKRAAEYAARKHDIRGMDEERSFL